MKANKEISKLLREQILKTNEERNALLREYKEISEKLGILAKEILEKERFISDSHGICDGISVSKRELYYDNRNNSILVARLHYERGSYFNEYDIIIEDEEVPD